MCTKILKKESSSRALAFFMLMFMMPLGFIGNVQNCGAMQHDTDEGRPLLGSAVVSINRDTGDVEEEEVFPRPLLRLLNHIPQVTVEPNLLEKVIPGKAQAQMNYIIDFISLHHNHKFFNKLQLKYQEEAKIAGVSIDNLETLQKYLENKAWDAISKTPTLADYLKARRLQTEGLIGAIEKIMGERDLLRQENQYLARCLDNFQEREKVKLKDGVEIVKVNESKNENNRDLHRQISILKYAVTPISFMLGVVLGCASGGLFVHFVWR